MPPAKRPSKPEASLLASDDLSDIRAAVRSQRGLLTRLTARMNELTSTPITRQAASRWLHQDARKRQEPKHGTALVMRRAYEELQSSAS